jgi:hypothetical protein
MLHVASGLRQATSKPCDIMEAKGDPCNGAMRCQGAAAATAGALKEPKVVNDGVLSLTAVTSNLALASQASVL